MALRSESELNFLMESAMGEPLTLDQGLRSAPLSGREIQSDQVMMMGHRKVL